jgi:hypothetical protein
MYTNRQRRIKRNYVEGDVALVLPQYNIHTTISNNQTYVVGGGLHVVVRSHSSVEPDELGRRVISVDDANAHAERLSYICHGDDAYKLLTTRWYMEVDPQSNQYPVIANYLQGIGFDVDRLNHNDRFIGNTYTGMGLHSILVSVQKIPEKTELHTLEVDIEPRPAVTSIRLIDDAKREREAEMTRLLMESFELTQELNAIQRKIRENTDRVAELSLTV